MFPTRAELVEKIRLGEDTFLELKEVRFAGEKVRGPAQDDLADELAAFANSRGGVLVLGVHDKTREVIGLPVDRMDRVEDLVRHACEDSIRQPIAPVIERLTLPNSAGVEQAVIRIDIASSLFVHQSPGGYMQRVGSSKRPIPPDQLARLFQQRSQARLIRFDETPVPGTTLADLDTDLWERFVSGAANEPVERVLSKLAMGVEDEAGIWRPSVAGVLMAARNPRKHVAGAYIQAVAYAGTAIEPEQLTAYQRDAADITGPLDEQIADACRFVRRNMRTRARKSAPGGRIDVPQYDMLAVFEAITNAVAHRDYSMGGSKVRLRMFDDRLEIYTPGMLVNTMTPESMPYRQAARNEALTSLLARCPVPEDGSAGARARIMDKRGEGVPIILSQSTKLAGKSPDFRLIDDSELLLTIYAANQLHDEE